MPRRAESLKAFLAKAAREIAAVELRRVIAMDTNVSRGSAADRRVSAVERDLRVT